MAEHSAAESIAVIGSGSLGSLFAARLSAVCNVTMLGSWTEQIRAVNNEGLTLMDPDGNSSLHFVKAASSTREFGLVDYALILVKGWQTPEAAEKSEQILADEGLAITLQNGIGNLEIIAQKVGSRRSALGVTSDGATLIEPGKVRHAGYGTTHIASAPETNQRVNRIADIFNNAGFETHVVEDADSLVWGKLAVNAGINPLTGLLQVPNGFLAEVPGARRLMEGAAMEAAGVAEAQGISLPFSSAAERALQVARETSANYSSMAQDVARGAPTEINTITRPIVELGQRYGVETPINETLLFLMLRLLQDGQWKSAMNDLPEELRLEFMNLIELADSQKHRALKPY